MTETEIKAALSDFDALWLTLFGEARSEPVEGQIAVACVIRNRVKGARRFGQSYRSVCLKPLQFSCWNEGADANHTRLMLLATEVVGKFWAATPRMQQLMFLAEGIIGGQLEDRVKGADHYLTTDLYVTKPPKWTKGQQPVAHVGAHTFFALG